MKSIRVFCPKCGYRVCFRNYWAWVLHCPFHWFGKRLTKCPCCNRKQWMKPYKNPKWKTIMETEDVIVEYSKPLKKYKVSIFEDGHFYDEVTFKAVH